MKDSKNFVVSGDIVVNEEGFNFYENDFLKIVCKNSSDFAKMLDSLCKNNLDTESLVMFRSSLGDSFRTIPNHQFSLFRDISIVLDCYEYKISSLSNKLQNCNNNQNPTRDSLPF